MDEVPTCLLLIDCQQAFTVGGWAAGFGFDQVPPLKRAFAACKTLLASGKLQSKHVELICTKCPFWNRFDLDFDPEIEPYLEKAPCFFKPNNSVFEARGFHDWMVAFIRKVSTLATTTTTHTSPSSSTANSNNSTQPTSSHPRTEPPTAAAVTTTTAKGKTKPRPVARVVVGGCTLTSCVRVSACDLQEMFSGQRLEVVVDLSLCGARRDNYEIRAGPHHDVFREGETAVECAIRTMKECGVIVVPAYPW
ncbi:hypothetical protein Pelo_2585 [Pelomyxa schiedti]|nr:hypothetical protein Pelo_2585 [Pelomyxa schiedti]